MSDLETRVQKLESLVKGLLTAADWSEAQIWALLETTGTPEQGDPED